VEHDVSDGLEVEITIHPIEDSPAEDERQGYFQKCAFNAFLFHDAKIKQIVQKTKETLIF